jgi:hypothetical protein
LFDYSSMKILIGWCPFHGSRERKFKQLSVSSNLKETIFSP